VLFSFFTPIFCVFFPAHAPAHEDSVSVSGGALRHLGSARAAVRRHRARDIAEIVDDVADSGVSILIRDIIFFAEVSTAQQK
jgi:hypothetical protein